MNIFYKAKVYYLDNQPNNGQGVVVAKNEAEAMNKVINYYGKDSIEQITFYFGDDSDVVELEEIESCPLFDTK